MFRSLLLIFILLFTHLVHAEDHYQGNNFSVVLKSMGKDAVLSFDLKNNAKFYWRNPGEIGLPTSIDFNGSTNLADIKIFWPIADLYQKNEVSSYAYQNHADFVIKPVAKNLKQDIKLNADISFAICDQSCQAFDLSLATIIKANSAPEDLTALLAKTVQPNGSNGLTIDSLEQKIISDEHVLVINFKSEVTLVSPKFLVDFPVYVKFDPAKFAFESKGDDEYSFFIPFSMFDEKHSFIKERIYVNLIDNGHAIEYEGEAVNVTPGFKDNSLWWILLYALIGGLILNIMPCVLPVLGLKIYQIARLAEQGEQVIRRNLIAQGSGIVFSFILFAIISYVLQQFGKQVGIGIQFQQPIYIITLVIILTLIAINLVGESFSIPVPNFLIQLFPKEPEKLGLCGSFFSGILTSLIAIPCTAPFITIAVAFALTANFLMMLWVFSLIGIGMAFPYFILAAIPCRIILPKPGPWMDKVKKIVGLVIYAAAIWLIYIISTQLGAKAAISLFLLTILLKFILLEKNLFSQKIKCLITVIVLILCYFVPHHLYVEKHQDEVMAEGFWREYQPDLIKNLIQQDRVILVDVTASWCVSCKFNKTITLENSAVISFMEKSGVIGMRADISKYNTAAVERLMKLHNHYGIPLNILYSKKHPEGLVLPIVLFPEHLIAAIKKINN